MRRATRAAARAEAARAMARAGTGRARAVDELKCDAVIKKKE